MFTRDELAEIVNWDRRSDWKIFDCKPQLKPSHTWNTNNKFLCKQIVSLDQTQCAIYGLESTWFLTNEPVLLGEIHFLTGQICRRKNQFTINTVEHDTENFDQYALGRVDL